MTCPQFVDDRTTGADGRCFALVLPFVPDSRLQTEHCTNGEHVVCPLYRRAHRDLSLAIHREVARAIG